MTKRASPGGAPVVAHVVHSLAVGGLENGLVNVVNGTRGGLRHVVVCMTTAGPMRERLDPGVEVLEIGKRAGHDPTALLRLARVLRRLRPTIVHSRNWATFDAVLAASLARVPRVVHGEHGRKITDPDGRNARHNRVRRLLAPLVDRFVTVSHDLNRWLVEDVRIPADKVVTIVNGVDTARFAARDRTAARAELALAPDRLVVGTVGRLDPVKDQAGLVHAFARVRAATPDAMLVVAGDGPCGDDLRALVASLGLGDAVRLLGERSDVATVLASLDVFVLPSIAEGISNTVLEAMATGLPIVATRVGGTPELVEDGANGVLVHRQDQAALAGAIRAYLEDPHLRAVHGKSSRQRAVEHFSLGRMCATYADLYAGLVRRA